MAIFPEIDVSQFAESPGQNGAAPAGHSDPAGVMAGLNRSLLALLANFDPGALGVCLVDDKLQLTLPVPDWSTWSHVAYATVTIGAGLATNTVLYTVPEDERNWLYSVTCFRESGDNLMDRLDLVFPLEYRTLGADGILVLMDVTGLTGVYWPDLGGVQTVTRKVDPTDPLMMEPGTTINLVPDGTGVASSNFYMIAFMKRSKLVRALAP